MSIDKKINYDVQGGVKNYLGKQKEVKAPLKWQSSPDHPTTELAYITKAEKDLLVKSDLHGSLKGGVNRGPSGIMSLNGFGSTDESQNVSGSQMSAAEAGDVTGFAGTGSGPQLPPGVQQKNKTAEDIRSAFIAAGGGQKVNPGFFDDTNTVSPAELAAAKAYDPTAFKKNRSSGIMDFITSGGFLGNIVKGLGQKFGLGKKYNEPTYNMSQYNQYGLGGSQTPTYYNDLDNDLMLSTEEKPTQTFNFDNSAMIPSNLNNLDLNKLETGDLNNISSLIAASQVPQDLDEIGKGADYVGYDKNELAAIAAGTKIPQLGDLTSFIDPLATITARERELKNYFNSPVQPKEGVLSYPSDLADEYKDLAIQASGTVGNYSQNAVANQLYGQDYKVLDPFTQGQIDTLIDDVGTKSTGELASGTSYSDI